MSSTLKILGAMALATALWSPANAQGLVTERNVSLAMAQTVANAAMEKCKEMGFRVSVTVVDRAGLPIVMLRGDGAGLHTPEGSDRKAYTARTFRAPSADFVKRMLNDPTAVGSKEYTRVLALAGGLPIKVGDDVVGAVGVSGVAGQGRRLLQGRHRQGGRPAQVSRGQAALRLHARFEALAHDARPCSMTFPSALSA